MAETIDPKVAAALEALSSAALTIEMPEDRRKQMAKFGGLFGRYSSQMMEAAEMSISAVGDLGFGLDAGTLEKVLMSSMSMGEKMAFQTRKAINKDLDAFFGSSENLKDLQNRQNQLKESQKRLAEAQKKSDKDGIEKAKAEISLIQRSIEATKSKFKLEDIMTMRMGQAIIALREAETETEQDFARARMKGVIDGQKLLLQSREELLRKLESSYSKLKEREGELAAEEEKKLKRMAEEIRLLREQNQASKKTIKKSEEMEGKTESGGYLKNLFARSFTGGLYGFLTEGTGPDEMISQMGRDAFGAITGKLGLSKAGAFGGSSEEARLEKTQKAEAAMTVAAGMATQVDLSKNEEDVSEPEITPLRLVDDGEEDEDRGLEELVRGAIESNKQLEMERKGEIVPEDEEGKDVVGSITSTAEDMGDLSKAALHKGSIYTHDIHSEKILNNIYKFLIQEKRGPTSASGGGGSALPIKGGGIRGTLGGIGGFLANIAEGVKRFANMKVVLGAGAMALVGASVIPFAYGLTILAGVPWANILLATAGMIGLAFTAAAIGKMAKEVALGALVMGAISVAFGIFAAGLYLIREVDPGVIATAVLALAGISALAFGIGALAMGTGGIGAGAVAIGAGLLALIGASFIPFAKGVSMLKGIDPNMLTGLGVGLLALAPGLAIIGLISPLLVLAGLGFAAMGIGLLPFVFSLSLIEVEKLMALSDTLNGFASNADNLLSAAGGILAIAAAIGAFSAAMGVGGAAEAVGGVFSAVGNKISSFISGEEKKSVFDQIMAFAASSGELMIAANALNIMASAIERLGVALGAFPESAEGMGIVNKLVNLDATQIKTLQDVSMAMDKVMTTNEKLKGEAESARMGQAAGAGAAVVVSNNSNVGSSTMMLPTSGRITDPSVLFSSARYHAMTYR